MTPILTTEQVRVDYLKKERQSVIARLVQESRKTGRPADSEQAKALYPRLDELFTWLENNISEISLSIQRASKIDEGLWLIYVDGNGFSFESKHVERARSLGEQLRSNAAVRQPAPETVATGVKREAPSSDDEAEALRSPRSPKRRDVAIPRKIDSGIDDAMANIKGPPFDHPIWGHDGIMHGMAYKKSGERKTIVINPEYKHLQRQAKVFGHNDITVARWFPYQLCAVFHGAHGASQAGISGDPNKGAYSIVVSGEYEDLDYDEGDVLYYSGSGSHKNTNPRETPASTPGTLALHASLASGNPVRVLRSHSGNGYHAPSKGLRYDGLYRVVDVRTPRNTNGGLYEQFKLERISREEDDLQIPINRCKLRPNGQDLKEYERIEWGYSSRR